MEEKKKLSFTYKMLRKLGYNYSEEEYGDVTVWKVAGKFLGNIRLKHLEKKMDWAILEPFAPRKLRPKLMRKMGCTVGKECFIGDYVRRYIQTTGKKPVVFVDYLPTSLSD